MKIEARWLSQKGTRTDDNRDHAGIAGRHGEFLAIVADGATNGSNNGGYRETEAAIATAHSQGALAVEMEAAALYAFAVARNRPVVCFAHVTNTMAQSEGDFEKGEADGATATLAVIATTVRAWSHTSG